MPDGISRTLLSSINLGDFALADYIAIFSLNFLPMKKSLPMGYRGLFSCRRSSISLSALLDIMLTVKGLFLLVFFHYPG